MCDGCRADRGLPARHPNWNPDIELGGWGPLRRRPPGLRLSDRSYSCGTMMSVPLVRDGRWRGDGQVLHQLVSDVVLRQQVRTQDEEIHS